MEILSYYTVAIKNTWRNDWWNEFYFMFHAQSLMWL